MFLGSLDSGQWVTFFEDVLKAGTVVLMMLNIIWTNKDVYLGARSTCSRTDVCGQHKNTLICSKVSGYTEACIMCSEACGVASSSIADVH